MVASPSCFAVTIPLTLPTLTIVESAVLQLCRPTDAVRNLFIGFEFE